MKTTHILASAKPWYASIAREELEAVPGCEEFVWAHNPEELQGVLESVDTVGFIFFLHWHWRVPEHVWQNHECVCFHMTDLPYGRGGSPLQNLIVRGHKETQLSALRMVDELDAGPIYAKRPLRLDGRAEDIFHRAARLSFELVRWIIETKPEPEPQVGEPVYFVRRTPKQSELPRQGDMGALHDHIRMLDAPTYPPAFVEHGDFVIDFSESELVGDEIVAKVRIRTKREK